MIDRGDPIRKKSATSKSSCVVVLSQLERERKSKGEYGPPMNNSKGSQ
jgi:hypothetical protein